MGILSGIPLYLILSTLFIWLTRENIDDSSLETMRSLLHVLGDPQLDFPVVHIIY